MTTEDTNPPQVTQIRDLDISEIASFLATRGLTLKLVEDGAAIPGSYWGAPEAGIIGACIHARTDTPIHSVLHTACHWLCMTDDRRAALHTDAGGDDVEEVAVCYLECLLADEIEGYSRDLVFIDMDKWGYNFRLGSAQLWFNNDSEEAVAWLSEKGLLTTPRPFCRPCDAF